MTRTRAGKIRKHLAAHTRRSQIVVVVINIKSNIAGPVVVASSANCRVQYQNTLKGSASCVLAGDEENPKISKIKKPVFEIPYFINPKLTINPDIGF